MTYNLSTIYTFDNEYEILLDELFEFAPQQLNNFNDTNLKTPNMNENNDLHSYKHWRPSSKLQRLYDSSMEFMFLLLGYQICNSSITMKFLTTDLPPTRTRSVLPTYMIDEDDENPYYNDTIMKYMHQPRDYNSNILLTR
ncbi:2677_t:CDS:2, partial [Gigaspora rosea]